MSSSPNLRDAQRRTWQLMNYEDGLWDLLLGLIFMMLAFYPVTRAVLGPERNLALFTGLVLVVAVLQLVLRRRISTPRLGYVKPRHSRARKLILTIAVLLVVLTFGLVVVTLVGPSGTSSATPSTTPTWLQLYRVEIIVLLVLVGLFSVMGYVFGVSRLYLYGWLLGGGNLASVIMNENAPERFNLPLAVAAGIILVIGSSLLVRFIRKYPARGLEA